MVERLRRAVRRVVFLQTIEHVQDPGAVLEHFAACSRPAASRSSRRRTCSRSRRRAPSAPATRGTSASTAPEEFRALCAAHFAHVELLGLFHARKLRAAPGRDRRGSGGTRVHAAARAHAAASTTASRRRSPRATSPCAPGATSTARSTSSRCCARDAHARPPGDRPAHAHAVRARASGRGRSARSGCGRRSRRPTSRCSTLLDRGAPVTLSLTPVLCDQLEAPGAMDRCRAFLRDVRPASHRARRRGRPRRRRRGRGPRARARRRRLRGAPSSGCRPT